MLTEFASAWQHYNVTIGCDIHSQVWGLLLGKAQNLYIWAVLLGTFCSKIENLLHKIGRQIKKTDSVKCSSTVVHFYPFLRHKIENGLGLILIYYYIFVVLGNNCHYIIKSLASAVGKWVLTHYILHCKLKMPFLHCIAQHCIAILTWSWLVGSGSHHHLWPVCFY